MDELALHDPRLDNTTLDANWEHLYQWEKTYNDPLTCSVFRNRKTNEVINYDPRMQAEALSSRGVPVEVLILV